MSEKNYCQVRVKPVSLMKVNLVSLCAMCLFEKQMVAKSNEVIVHDMFGGIKGLKISSKCINM